MGVRGRAGGVALGLALALGLTLLAPALAARARAERAERHVDLVVDYDAVAALAAAQGVPPVDVLRRLRAAGATGVAVRELQLDRLAGYGRVRILDPRELARVAAALAPALPPRALPRGVGDPRWTHVTGQDPDLGVALYRAWRRRHAEGALPEPPRLFPGPRWLLLLPAPPERVRAVPLGVPADAVAAARAAGLDVVPVLGPGLPAPVEPPWIPWAEAGLRPRLVIVAGDPAPGYPGQVEALGARLRAWGAAVGLVEHWDQLGYLTRRGARELVEAAGGRLVRVYSIQPELRDRLPPEEQRDRILTSVLERRLRAVYLYPLSHAPDPVAATAEHVTALAAGLRRLGLEPGPARGLLAPPPPPPAALWGGLAAAAVAAAGAAAACLRPVPAPAAWKAAAAATPALALAATALAGDETRLRQAGALLAALAFPLLGGAAAAAVRPGAARAGVASRLARGAAAALAGWAVALAGGLVVAGLLATAEFMQVWAFFRGVKVSLALPVLAWAAALWLEGPRTPGRGRRAAAWALALAMVLVLAAVARSMAVRVPEAEVAVRRLLADLFAVRPRFKEFLLGIPALVLLGALAPPRPGPAFAAVSLAGLVGLTSVVNSFAHVFTPLSVSAWRSLNGLLLGLAVGLPLAALALRWGPGPRPPALVGGARPPGGPPPARAGAAGPGGGAGGPA